MVDEFGEFLLLEHEDPLADDLEAEGLGEAGGDPLHADVLTAGAVGALEQVHRADVVPGAHEHAAVGQPVDAADAGLEALGPQVHQIE